MTPLDLVITPGDPEGIGPEVTEKALLALKRELSCFNILIVGSSHPFKRRSLLSKLGRSIQFIEPAKKTSPGHQSGWSIERATELLMAAPKSRALITGPISKERIQNAGFPFNGHTDFLAKLSGTKQVTMVLKNKVFRVALVTDHCELKKVPSKVTQSRLSATFNHTFNYLKNDVGLKKPKIAMLGLNPHAGEGGVIGNEETKTIKPFIEAINLETKSKLKYAPLTGPHSADSFFAVELKKRKHQKHDLIIAHYHDQGLIPVKLVGFGETINITLGLPFIRTSVDHGTAFDLAGKNKANESSMICALKEAMLYLNKRRSL